MSKKVQLPSNKSDKPPSGERFEGRLAQDIKALQELRKIKGNENLDHWIYVMSRKIDDGEGIAIDNWETLLGMVTEDTRLNEAMKKNVEAYQNAVEIITAKLMTEINALLSSEKPST